MFEYLGTILVDIDPGFDVLRYLTVRTLGGTVTGLLISILLGPIIIKSLKSMQFEQHVRVDGPKSHYKKSGTPTMGGLLILSSLVISTLLWADLGNRYIWVVLFTTIAFASIGFFDDYLKIKNNPFLPYPDTAYFVNSPKPRKTSTFFLLAYCPTSACIFFLYLPNSSMSPIMNTFRLFEFDKKSIAFFTDSGFAL